MDEYKNHEQQIQEILCQKVSKFPYSNPSTAFLAGLAIDLQGEKFTPAMVEEVLNLAARSQDRFPSLHTCLRIAEEHRIKEKYVPKVQRTESFRKRISPWPISIETLMLQRTKILSGKSYDYIRKKIGLSDSELDDLEMCFRAKDWNNEGALQILKKVHGNPLESVADGIMRRAREISPERRKEVYRRDWDD